MTQRVLVGRGVQDVLSRDLNRRLQAIKRNYYHRLISKERAKESGRAVLEDEFKVLLNVSRDRIYWSLKRRAKLPPEELARLERWRDNYVADFGRIIDDTRRAGE